MRFRHIAYWAMIASIILVPAWVMFGRAFFGAPLGTLLFGQALLVPGFALLLGAVVGITVARKAVRSQRAVAWRDIALIGPLLLAGVLLGIFVVDSNGALEASAASLLFGASFTDASAVIAGGLGFGIFVYGLWLVVHQVRTLAAETRNRFESFAERAQHPQQPVIVGEASFDPLSDDERKQQPRVIRIDSLE